MKIKRQKQVINKFYKGGNKMARIYTAKCTLCNAEYPTIHMIATPCANRGSAKRSYMCQPCATQNQNYDSGRDTEIVGNVNNGFKYGIELETVKSSEEFRNLMFRFGFIPTHDGSLNNVGQRRYRAYGFAEASCEYVSGTNKGLKRFTKQFIEIEKHLNEGNVVIDESCGTHCHISYNDMRNGEMEKICKYYQSLFLPVQNVMLSNVYKTERFFGRFFCHYAPAIENDTRMRVGHHDDRYRWVNCTNSSNIEFRLNKFVSAKQMLECIKYEKWIVETIEKDFIEKWGDAQNRKANAKQTGEKIAAKLEKIYNAM